MDKIWDEIHRVKKWGGYPSETVIRFVARNYYNEHRNTIRILDFGCGAGAHTWYLAREGFDTYAFDGSSFAIENAKANLDKEGLQANFSVMDGVKAIYQENFFDAIIDNVCICTNRIADIETMFKNIYFMLKPEGKFLSTCFTTKTNGFADGDYVEPGTYMNIKEGPLSHMLIHFFNKDELRARLMNAGFKNVQIDILHYTDNGRIIEEYVAQAEK